MQADRKMDPSSKGWGAVADRIDRAIFLISRMFAFLGVVSVAGMAALISLAVVMRYALGSPFAFTEELWALMLVSCVFLTLPYVIVINQHIRVELAVESFGRTARRIAFAIGQLVFVAFALVFFVNAWEDVKFTAMLGLRTEVARITLLPFVSCMAAGVALSGLIALWQIFRPLPVQTTSYEMPEGGH